MEVEVVVEGVWSVVAGGGGRGARASGLAAAPHPRCGPWSRVEVVVEGAVGGREVEFDRSRPLTQNPDKTSDRGY